MPVGSLPDWIPAALLECRDQQCWHHRSLTSWWGVPHTPNPGTSSLLESVSVSAQPFSLSQPFPKESKCCLCLGTGMGCADALKNVSFLKLVPANANHLICSPSCGRGRNKQQREVFARAGPAFALGTCTLSKAESFNSSSSWGQE